MHSAAMDSPQASPDTCVWTRREKLVFPDVRAGARYALPFFAHKSLRGPLVFADDQGRVVPHCQDSLHGAPDHTLLWLDERRLDSPDCAGTRHLHVFLFHLSAGDPKAVVSAPPEEVLPLAEFFPTAEEDDGPLTRWRLEGSPGNPGIRFLPSTAPPLTERRAPRGNALCFSPSAGGAPVQLRCRPAVDRAGSRLLLRARFHDPGPDVEPQMSHWIGITSRLGICSIGVSPKEPGHYVVYSGLAHSLSPTKLRRKAGWRFFEVVLQGGKFVALVDFSTALTGVLSSTNFDELISIGTSGEPAMGLTTAAAWGAIEFLHTPLGDGIWDTGKLKAQAGKWKPWSALKSEKGQWELDFEGVMQEHRSLPQSEEIVAREEEGEEHEEDEDVEKQEFHGLDIQHSLPLTREDSSATQLAKMRVLELFQKCDVNLDGMIGRSELAAVLRYLDKAAWPDMRVDTLFRAMDRDGDQLVSYEDLCEWLFSEDGADAKSSLCRATAGADSFDPALVPSASRSISDGKPPKDMTVDCWSLPVPEAAVARVDRVMATFLEAFEAAGVTVPENVVRVEACSNAHLNCYVYTFGTKKVHVSTREGEDGRLTLVIRCGGGFLDVIEFVRRYGCLEQLKLKRSSDASSNQSNVRLASVLQSGCIRVKQYS